MTNAPWNLEAHFNVSPAQLEALGAAILEYNALEHVFSYIFEFYMGSRRLEDRPTYEYIFDIMTNKNRSDTLHKLVNERETDAATGDLALFALKCLDICTENRNHLAHMIYDRTDSATDGNFIVRKKAFDKVRIQLFSLSLAALRSVAEETAAVTTFAVALTKYLNGHRNWAAADPLRSFGLQPPKRPDKPPQPSKLDLHLLPAGP